MRALPDDSSVVVIADRWTDDDGHAWPLTGRWCDACGLPLDAILADVGVHAGCEVTS